MLEHTKKWIDHTKMEFNTQTMGLNTHKSDLAGKKGHNS